MVKAVIALARAVNRRFVGIRNTASAVISEGNIASGVRGMFDTPEKSFVVVEEGSEDHEFVKRFPPWAPTLYQQISQICYARIRSPCLNSAQDARRERLLKEGGVVYEVLYVEGITHSFASKIHSDGLLRDEADKIFDTASPHARVCVVTQRVDGVDVSTWHRVWLPTSRWHQTFLTKWVKLLRGPEMADLAESALVLGIKGQSKEGGQFSATGWELSTDAVPTTTGMAGSGSKAHCLSKVCACLT